MSGNSIKIASILLISLIDTIYPSNIKEKRDSFFEDTYIVKGLISEEARDFYTASETFLYLYEKTGDFDYLKRALNDAIDSDRVSKKLIRVANRYLKKSKAGKNREVVAVWLAKYYTHIGDIDRADEIIDRYLSDTKDLDTLKQVYTIYLYQKRYDRAYKILKKRYSISPDSGVIVDEAELLYKKLGKKIEAKKLLESYIQMHKDVKPEVFMTLINLYIAQNDVDGIIRTYEAFYDRYPKRYLLQKIIKLYLYKKDLQGLIAFLKKHEKGNEDLLYMIYKEKRDIKNALSMADKLYNSTRDPKWLAEKAMLLYEDAKKNNKITPQFLQKFSELFNRAIEGGADDSVYLNYYGYTLIDHDIDIKKGLRLVREALEQKPKSFYYLDSLAWGLYKEGRCKEAKEAMDEVEKLGGLKEDEIKEHKILIDKCINNKKDK